MLSGNARITAIDNDGRSYVKDVVTNDLWFFPGGTPHSIQGLGPEGAEFLLVFDDGNFSEGDTTLISDWTRHTPVPGSLEEDRRAAIGSKGPHALHVSDRENEIRRSANYRFAQFSGFEDNSGGTRDCEAGRLARIALASECG